MSGALEGIRVLDLARVLSGPHCAMILGDLGAEVIKIEKPGVGDMTRENYPRVKGGESTYFLAHNRNKKSITLDFRKEQSRNLFLELVKKSDIIVENFRAGTMEKMGFDYETLKKVNKRIILTRISGFGQDGPYSNRTCFDGAAQAISGLMDITGDEFGQPYMTGTYIVDYSSALYAVIGTLAALRQVEITGEGQVVDVALLDAAVSLLHTAIPDYKMLGQKFTRKGNNDRYAWPANIYKAKDGRWVYIHAGMDNTFSKIAKIIGHEEVLQDERYNNREGRARNKEYCDKLISDWVTTKPADEVVSIVASEGIPCSRVNDVTEMMQDPQVNYRNMIAEVEHPTAGKVYLAGPAIHFSKSEAKIQYAPPILGQHNNEIYGGLLGLSDEEIEELKKANVI